MKPHQQEQAKADYLDKLYELDNRSDPEHPFHDSYTGLYQERVQWLVNRANEKQIADLVEADMKSLLQADSDSTPVTTD